MKHNLSENRKRALAARRARARGRRVLSLLACLVLLATLWALRLPAVTSDSGAYRLESGALLERTADPEPSVDPEPPVDPEPALLRAEAARSEIYYSSDLADFVTGVILRDGDGNEVGPEGIVYLGERYDITLSFSESNVAGQERQFAYNDQGELTFQIPALFVCTPVTDGVLTEPNGQLAGSYTIDGDSMLHVRFREGFIDSSLASLTVSLRATASSAQGTGLQSVSFGDYSILVTVSSAGRLSLEKTAGSYDPRSHSIDYQVAVRALGGPVTGIRFMDSPDPGLSLVAESLRFTSLDGQTVYPDMPDSLAAGEGFLVSYRAALDSALYQGLNHVSYTARNTAAVTGVNDDGPVSAQDTAETRIDTWFLRKSGGDDAANSRIHWTVTVGDGSVPVDGLVLTELPGAGLVLDTASGVQATPYTWSPAGELTAGTPFTLFFEGDPGRLTLPPGQNACRYVLTYFTGYDLPEGVSAQTFENAVSLSVPSWGELSASASATGHAVGTPPGIVKQASLSPDGRALHYAIAVTVPGAYQGNTGFYLYDSCTKLRYGGVEYFFGQDFEALSVWTETAGGARRDYLLYDGGGAAYTYAIRRPRDPRSFYLLFNTASPYLSGSAWIESEDVTLHVEYDLPLDAPVYIRPDGSNYVLSESVTLRDLLGRELGVDNTARLYYDDERLYVQATDRYQQYAEQPFRKEGRVAAGGTVEYQVLFNNRDGDFNTLLQRGMKELIFRDELLTAGLSYVDGSLFCDLYSASLGSIIDTYRYAPAIGGSAALEASAADFLWYSGSHPQYATLLEFAGHSYIGGSASSSSRLVFRYRAAVDDAAFPTTEPTVPLHNRARLTGVLPDDTTLDTGYADCTVHYPIEIFKKRVEHAEGSSRADFTITLNPAGLDLLEEVTVMTVVDTMTETLQPVLSTLRTELLLEGVWTDTPPQYLYNPAENTLTFTLPDSVPIRIRYTALITQTGADVSIGNTVRLEGFAAFSAAVNTHFRVDETSGAAQADSFRLTLLKQAADSLAPLPGAVFALYGPENSERQSTPPPGTPETLSVGGQTLWYYTAYTTGENGLAELETNEAGLPLFSVQGLYALLEITPPAGYQPLDAPLCFYAQERPAAGDPEIPVVVSLQLLTAADRPVVFTLPETGGGGTLVLYLPGLSLLAAGGLGLLRRRKKWAAR